MLIMEKAKLLLIDADDNSRYFIKELAKEIEQLEISGEAVDFGRGYDMVRQLNPTIVVLDLYPSVDVSLRLAERILQYHPNTIILVTSLENDPETILKAMRAGAREFLSKPFKREEVDNALQSAVRIFRRTQSAGERNGKLISVFGVKGGVGSTTIAANLAVNISKRSKREVLLVDMNLQLGNAALFLNLRPRNSIIDVARHIAEIEPENLRQSLSRHDSGVSLLTGPRQIEEVETFKIGQLEMIISLLRASYDYIIVDLPKYFDEFTMKTLDSSDVILMLFTADLPSIFNTFRCIDIFKRLKYGEDKVLLMINRFDDNSAATLSEIKNPLRYPVFRKIPNQDFRTIIDSINQGKPLVSITPNSILSQSLVEIADHFIDIKGEEEEEENGTRWHKIMNKFLTKKNNGNK